ncbi:MAG: hypothetical protein EPO11_09245 [Gammaproteobacteria bacterium]|nr:MAG: hypothetical protein EPO11_09245 [Gammaproteobacteria bacterium]
MPDLIEDLIKLLNKLDLKPFSLEGKMDVQVAISELELKKKDYVAEKNQIDYILGVLEETYLNNKAKQAKNAQLVQEYRSHHGIHPSRKPGS